MSSEKNPYSSPELFGLELIGTLSEEDLSYEFNEFAVWKNKKGELFYAQDSGCSCPSFFEDFDGEETLIKITKENFIDFENAVSEFPAPTSAKEALMPTVRGLLNQSK